MRRNLAREIVGGVSNCMVSGPPGSGKTTLVLAVARELFPYPADFKRRVLELNASNDRGINVVRTKIATFARQSISRQQQTLEPGKNTLLPPVRIVILDEADRMTPEAQAALRQMMERYGKLGVRFFIICNYKSDIIVPLVSRCQQIPFSPPPADEIVRRLYKIAHCEGLLDDIASASEAKSIFAHIARRSNGDMRQAMHWLQNIAQRQRSRRRMLSDKSDADSRQALIVSSSECKLSIDHMSGSVPDESIETLLALLLNVIVNPDTVKAAAADHALWCATAQRLVLDEAFSLGKCIEQLSERIVSYCTQNTAPTVNRICAEYLYRLAHTDVALHAGGDPQILLYSIYHASVAQE